MADDHVEPQQPAAEPQKESAGESYHFTAEIQKLLDIVVHSLYTHKEIFLRELVSNASDALDKVRFLKITGKAIRDPEIPLEIKVEVDKDKKILTISDTGIGMTKDELIENIGTIAHSGSKSFIQKLSEISASSNPLNLIGQFGVGFYSVFMAAKRVEIITLSANTDATAQLWTSEGLGQYTIQATHKAERGTQIRLYLTDEAKEFVETQRIKTIVQRYSDFIAYPILLDKSQINKLAAIWHRPVAEVKEEEYKEHYNYLTHTQEAPLLHIHLAVDAPIQFKGILYIPSNVPLDIMLDIPEKWHGVHLYAKRIFIQADCEELLPQYLRFARGVIDSDDLPLNISRETLQENTMVAKIKQTVVRKILDKLQELSAEKPDEYQKFWQNFGKFLKQGYRNDYGNRERLAELFRFNTSACTSSDEWISLEQYTNRMLPGQKEIYYLIGESRETLLKSPHLELCKSKGVEVLYLTDPVDDFLVEDLREYKDIKFFSVDQEGLALDHIEAKKTEEEPPASKEKVDVETDALENFIKYLRDLLKERVADVRISKRLTDSPCCLVSSKDAPNLGMQKLFRLMHENYEMPKRVLEINQDHPLVRRLAQLHAQKTEEMMVSFCCHQLLDNALILEGSPFETRDIVPRTQSLMESLTKFLMPGSKS